VTTLNAITARSAVRGRGLARLRPLLRRSNQRFGFPRYSWLLDRANWEARLYSTVSKFPSAVELPTCGDLYRYVSRELLDDGAKTIDYLEFGVYRGETFREWCALNRNPHSRFFGFDSFEGLPEDWNPRQPKGAFDTGGRAPELDDARAQFVVGLFQDSLPGFLRSYQAHDQLVLHIDCDLYSSTLYCLSSLDRVIGQGTVIIFDEFYDSLHEYRALTDYCSAYMRAYRLIAHTKDFVQAAVTIV
jgi:Macrocin-O-methyltransferase (TylF)